MLLGVCTPFTGIRGQVNSKGAKFIPDDQPATAAPDQGRKWAVVVGVNEYTDPGIPPLKYCVADARLVAKQLAEKCGYDPAHVLLIDDDQTKVYHRPLKRNLQIQVAAWLKRAGPKDTVLVFFSGHGFLDDAGRGFLAPTDCERDRLAPTSLSTEELRDMLRQCRATQKMLVLDCCHAGGAKGVETGTSGQELGSSFRLAAGLITMASCQKKELSYEWDAKGHSLFTYFLAEGLSGAADKAGNGDGVVDSDELYAYTLDNVSVFGQQELNAQQTPVRIIGEDVVGRFALTRVKDQTIATRPIPADGIAPPVPPRRMVPDGPRPDDKRSLSETLAELIAFKPSGKANDVIKLGLVLNEAASSSDLAPMLEAMRVENAQISYVVVPPIPEIRAMAQQAIGRSNNAATCGFSLDVRNMLDSKSVDAVAIAAPLKREVTLDHLGDNDSSKPSPSIGVLIRDLVYTMQSGKDVYVSLTSADRASWKPDPNSNDPPPGTEMFFGTPQGGLGREAPLEAPAKYNRVTSYGGIDWGDFKSFLHCVRSREQPPNTLLRYRIAKYRTADSAP
jgi:uncharacterized caspase-like protein